MDYMRPEAGLSQKTPEIARSDTYQYARATEASNPELVATAREIHAKSYRGEGFIYEDAIGSDGQILEDIDRSRGESVIYYVGSTPEGAPVSTMRMVPATPDSGGFRGLSGYDICRDVISPEAHAFLVQAEEEGRDIVEMSAFGHIPEVSSASGIEMLRHVYHEARGSGAVWYFSMVSQKIRVLQRIFGPKAIRVVGDPVLLEDSRVSGVTLTPGIVDTDTFFDDICESIAEEETPALRERYQTYLRIFTEGVDRSTLSPEVLRQLGERPHESLATLALRSGVEVKESEWSQPREFQLRKSIDRASVERLIRSGAVKHVRGPVEHEDDVVGGVLREDTAASEAQAAAADETGSWFYFPWSGSLVHYPPREEYREQRQSRDRGLVTKEEHDRLAAQRPLFAGLSVGSHVLEHMLYAGVGGSHILADFDAISTSNLNRIHAGGPNVGEKKIDYFAQRTSELDPYLPQTLLREGITPESLMDLNEPPTIIFDEVDDFSAKVLLRQYAREQQIPLIMATDVGYRSLVDIERYDLGQTELFNGRLKQGLIDAMLAGKLTPEQRTKVTAKLIGLGNVSMRLMKAVNDPLMKSFPQLELTAAQGGVLATAAARDILLGRQVNAGRRVVDIRESLWLKRETGFVEGAQIVKQFLDANDILKK